MLMWFCKAKSFTENSNLSLNSMKNIYMQLNNLKCAITLLLWRLVPYKVVYSAVLLPAIAYQQLDYEKSTSEGQFQVACAASANTSELRSPFTSQEQLSCGIEASEAAGLHRSFLILHPNTITLQQDTKFSVVVSDRTKFLQFKAKTNAPLFPF